MNYATIKYYDIANGPGVRTSVFVSGCRHHCPGCFNEVAWDFGYGAPFDKPVRNEVFASCKPDYIAGLSLLGGEPMEPENQRELVTFVQNFKALYPKKTVWCYSGYTWEQLTGKVPCHARCEVTAELLRLLCQVENINIAQSIAVGDGANDLPMLDLAGLGIAFHAKPKVKATASQSISTIGLDGVLYFLGLKDSWIE